MASALIAIPSKCSGIPRKEMASVQRAKIAEFCDAIALELLNGEQPVCEECNGSGQCHTCCGMGVIEETELIAA
jgi:hypothetical protein